MAPLLSGLPDWTNYEFASGLTLGFHGCDESVGEAVLRGQEKHLHASENDYDWLGTGVYFWEGNPLRALEFALERVRGGQNSRGTIQKPFVLGAIINPRRTLNLADGSALLQAKSAYEAIRRTSVATGQALPSNGRALRARRLDCLVLNTLHGLREAQGLPSYDSVRGLFFEGEELYPGAGMREADHVQICVRNTDCILGYFRPLERGS